MLKAAVRAVVRGGLVALALVALLGSTMGAAAQSSTDKQSDGQFTGIALITSNLRWYELFERPEPPRITGVDHLKAGEHGALAIIFSNAEPRNETVRVECDVTAFDPGGSSPVVKSGVCYEGPYHGDNVLHPALLDLQFAMGANDPPGRAGFKITLRDAYSSRKVKLNVVFTQGPGK